jgi:hypothetical protein
MSILITHRRTARAAEHILNSFVLQSPDTTKWLITINQDGLLRTHSGAIGTVTDIKVTGGSDISGEASFGISNLGELEVRNGLDLSGTATLNDDFKLRGEDGTIYRLAVSVDDEIQTITV